MLAIFERLTHLLFAPDEVILQRKTLMIIANHGYIGCRGHLHMRGGAVFLDFLTADEDPPPRALSLKFTEVIALTRDRLDEACAENPNDTRGRRVAPRPPPPKKPRTAGTTSPRRASTTGF